MTISSFSTTNAEARLLHLNHRVGSFESGSGNAFSNVKLSEYPSSPEQMGTHLKARRENGKGNVDRRETLVGNAILDYLEAGGSRERLAEILAGVPPDEHLPDFLRDDDPRHPKNRLTELLKEIPVVEIS